MFSLDSEQGCLQLINWRELMERKVKDSKDLLPNTLLGFYALTKGRSPTESSKAADACLTSGRMSRSKSVSLLNENFERHTYGKQN